MMTLAYGMDPIRAAGVASGLWFFLLFDVAFLSKCWKWLGQDRLDLMQFGNMPLALLFALVLFGYKP